MWRGYKYFVDTDLCDRTYIGLCDKIYMDEWSRIKLDAHANSITPHNLHHNDDEDPYFSFSESF